MLFLTIFCYSFIMISGFRLNKITSFYLNQLVLSKNCRLNESRFKLFSTNDESLLKETSKLPIKGIFSEKYDFQSALNAEEIEKQNILKLKHWDPSSVQASRFKTIINRFIPWKRVENDSVTISLF